MLSSRGTWEYALAWRSLLPRLQSSSGRLPMFHHCHSWGTVSRLQKASCKWEHVVHLGDLERLLVGNPNLEAGAVTSVTFPGSRR